MQRARASIGVMTNTAILFLVIRLTPVLQVSPDDMKALMSHPEEYERVLMACAANAKIGPFTATSGLILDYYLNAATNMMDAIAAPMITRMILDLLSTKFRPNPQQRLLVVGMEMAGGVMVGQCAATASITHPKMCEWCDFVYCRKKRKSSGTCQQLEGPRSITDRTPESSTLHAVFLDDAMSSGGSMRDAALLLKEDYNIELQGAVYLVDRSRDRKELDHKKLGLTDPILANTKCFALFDLDPHMHEAIMTRTQVTMSKD